MAFSWMNTTPPRTGGVDARTKDAASELATRAGLLFRLGYSAQATTERLCKTIAWEFDDGAHERPAALSDAAIGKIVTDTYARKPR